MPALLKSLLALACVATTVVAQGPLREVDTNVFPSITPSKDLEWQPCYNATFLCARMIVPAKIHDYREPQVTKKKCSPDDVDTVQLAIIKLPYTPKAPTDPPRRGSIHISLGAWSQSSTNFVIRYAQYYIELFAGYDLIAIDYRGFGYSTPSYNCFANEDERKAWVASDPPLFGSNEPGLAGRRRQRAEELAERCDTVGGKVGKYIGTYPSAVDHHTVMKADGDDTMGFWGISSGSHLAETVATLFPEAVDRFALDAITPSRLAYTVTSAQVSQALGADVALEAFFTTCLQAPTNDPMAACPFKGASTTSAELRARYNAVEQRIRRNPLPTPPGTSRPFFDYSAFYTLVGATLYSPAVFPILGGVLAEAEAGQAGDWISAAYTFVLFQPPPPIARPADETPPFEGYTAGPCIDAQMPIPDRRGQFDRYLQRMLTKVPTVAPILVDSVLLCSKWQTRSVNRIDLDLLDEPVALGADARVLITNNVADPAASLKNAAKVVERFPGSVLVQNVGVSHTNFLASSKCIYSKLFQLFILGTVPPEGERVCNGIDNHTAPFNGVQLPTDFGVQLQYE